jgi:hypothetical protein
LRPSPDGLASALQLELAAWISAARISEFAIGTPVPYPGGRMFDAITAQLSGTAGKLSHLRRFL